MSCQDIQNVALFFDVSLWLALQGHRRTMQNTTEHYRWHTVQTQRHLQAVKLLYSPFSFRKSGLKSEIRVSMLKESEKISEKSFNLKTVNSGNSWVSDLRTRWCVRPAEGGGATASSCSSCWCDWILIRAGSGSESGSGLFLWLVQTSDICVVC